METVVIVIFVALVVAVVVWLAMRDKKPSSNDTQKPEQQASEHPEIEQLSAESEGVIKIKSDTWYMCKKEIKPYEEGIVYLGADIDPGIKLWFKYFRLATDEEIGQQHPKPVECHAKTYPLEEFVSATETEDFVQVGTYDTTEGCDCHWEVIGFEWGFDFLKNFVFKDGMIFAKVNKENVMFERTARYKTRHTGKGGTHESYFDVTQKAGYITKFEDVLNKFVSVVKLEYQGDEYNYLWHVFQEAYLQYYRKKSNYGLPMIMTDRIFLGLNVADKDDNVFTTLAAWTMAEVLADLLPKKRTLIFKIAYEAGGFDRYSNIYGYAPKLDPNKARIVAAVIEAAVDGCLEPDKDAMRENLKGSKYDKTLDDLSGGRRDDVGENDFFIDFREFMPTAPGPYAPGYTDRPDFSYPDEEKDEYGNLVKDRNMRDYFVSAFNLDSRGNRQRTVQAIADKEGDMSHLFGRVVKAGDYAFTCVFGYHNIGVAIDPDGAIAKLCKFVQAASNASRGILQSATVSPKQYGRLRPGCSWEREAVKHSDIDNTQNVLTNWDIEDGDGCPTGYYDKDGYWTHPEQCSSPEQYEEMQRNTLYANSYPSGHAAGIMAVVRVLCKLMPRKADVILKAGLDFAESRAIARYHWWSDVINGLVLGTAQHAVSMAASDYRQLLKDAQKECESL